MPTGKCSSQQSSKRLLFAADGGHCKSNNHSKCREHLTMGCLAPADVFTALVLKLQGMLRKWKQQDF